MPGIDRDEVVERIAAVLQRDDRIVGLVLIGSGAVGYLDDFSDVDLMTVVARGHDEVVVGDELIDAITRALPTVWLLDSGNMPTLRSLLLDGYLEVDLSFVSLDRLVATEDRWRVVFDRSGEIAERMAVVQRPDDPVRSARAAYVSGIASLWFGLKALRRGRPLSASAHLSGLRGALAVLYAVRSGFSPRVASFTADGLPAEARAVLHALAVPAEANALEVAFFRGFVALRAFEGDGEPRLVNPRYDGFSDWAVAKYGIEPPVSAG